MNFVIPNHFKIGINCNIIIDSSCRSVSKSGRLVMRCSVSDWRTYQAAREERHRKLVAHVKRNTPKNVCLLN